MQKILSEIKFVNVSTVIRKLYCIVIYIILQQTNFAPREGVFDISVFFLGTEFDMKIGLKHEIPGYAQPPLPRGLTLTGALIGSLNNKVGDGYKNVAYKVKLHCFKLIALSLFHSIRQIVAIFFGVQF